ncbi:T9SS type A sorting domain-containing protein [Empedobacter brevis]|uniref:T9SS type A sorting domain-containing protein n=1 Tax=Empedobacter brevis TaxID=247 RepID=UPI002896E124|nr:T9SS type A sorting domain-containing protein [Empedobacter brevis]
MKLKSLLLGAILLTSANQAYGQYIAREYMGPHGVANDGTVSGYKEWGGSYFLWSPETGELEEIGGVAPGNGFGGTAAFSDDSNLISGTSFNNGDPSLAEMSVYNRTTKTWKTLGSWGGVSGESSGAGYNISGNGKVIAGHSYLPGSNLAVATAWNEKDGLMRLQTSIKDKQSRVEYISQDGSVLVGYQANETGNWDAAVWYKNTFGKGYFTAQQLTIDPNKSAADPKNRLAWATVVSGNGKWIGGNPTDHYKKAWLWNMEVGLVDMGSLTDEPGTKGYTTTMAYDGSTVYGYHITQATPWDQPVYRPFIWTKATGMLDLNDYVRDVLKFDTNGDHITVPTELSPNGKYLAGWAVNYETTEMKMFRIEMPKLGTDEINKAKKATLYPNPVTNILNIEAKGQISQIKVYNLTGQEVTSRNANSKNEKVDLSTLKEGIYIVEVVTDSQTTTYKVIKK